jgi:hypothetical protein
MGIRHIEDLDRLAEEGGMYRARLYGMPANNMLVIWLKDTERHAKRRFTQWDVTVARFASRSRRQPRLKQTDATAASAV